MFEAKGQSSRSQRNVMYKQEKRSKTATDRLSDFILGTGNELKRIGTAWRRAASSCNAYAIATFSSFLLGRPTKSDALSFTAVLFRQADVVGRLKLYCCTFFRQADVVGRLKLYC